MAQTYLRWSKKGWQILCRCQAVALVKEGPCSGAAYVAATCKATEGAASAKHITAHLNIPYQNSSALG